MKTKQIKLRWKLFAYIFIFAALIVFIFCFFQIFLLESSYKRTKSNSINSLLSEVADVVSNSKSEALTTDASNSDYLYQLASTSETAIYLLDSNGNMVLNINTGLYYNEFIKKDVYTDIYDKAKSTSLSKFYVTFSSSIPSTIGKYPAITSKLIDSLDSAIILGRFVKTKDNIELMIVIDSRLTPVTPAVETLKRQLFYISIIVTILSIAIALLISQWISKPLRVMQESAKRLAKGSRDVSFKGKGYQEILDLNQSLNYAVSEINKANTLQKELLANISHDLKTPLTLIEGYAEMMIDFPEEVKQENLEVIVEETKRLTCLVNDLVNLSKLQAKTENFNFEKMNLVKMVKDIVERQQKLQVSKDIKIHLINNTSKEEIMIIGDEIHLSQVVYNFLTNAFNYSADSKLIEVIIDELGDKVRVGVRDYGEGISEEELNVIWNRYYRVDKAHKRVKEGSGLGLSIVKEILEAHHFEYGVESKIKEGSLFYFIANIVK